MIFLTKLDGTKTLVSVEAIKYLESVPDTLILFLNGDSIIVRETLDEVRSSVIEFKSSVIKRAKDEH